MNTLISIKNNQAISLSKIPQVAFSTFVEQLAEIMDADSNILSCFVTKSSSGSSPNGFELFTLIGRPATKDITVFRSEIAESYPSLTCRWPQFQLFEREIAEQYGILPEGHPWLKPVRFHQVWEGSKDVWGRDLKKHPLVGDMEYFQVIGDEIHEVGVGPVHAGIIEPGHFRFQCFGEKVLNLEISLGFQHRGVERTLVDGPHAATPYQMETLAGDTSVGHMLAYSQVTEALNGQQGDQLSTDLRLIGLELERLANHVGDIGALAGDVGYLPTSSFCGRLRGDYLNMSALICGSRFGRGLIRPGGSLFGLDQELRDRIKTSLKLTAVDTNGALDLFFKTPSVLSRLEGTGVVSTKDARILGLTGVAGRACGLDTDSRRHYPSAGSTGEEYPLLCGEDGDVYSRAHVRKQEIDAATDFILRKLDNITPGASTIVEAPICPNMLAVSLVEGWRGRVAHVALTDDRGKFMRYKVVDPSFFNWSGLALSLRDEQISDFPLCNKSFNLSYCGFDL